MIINSIQEFPSAICKFDELISTTQGSFSRKVILRGEGYSRIILLKKSRIQKSNSIYNRINSIRYMRTEPSHTTPNRNQSSRIVKEYLFYKYI